MHPVILVVGASGGLGASTLAALTATVLARDGASTLVDADLGGGGLDTTLGVEHVDGLRWGDLAEHEGEVDAVGLRGALPCGPVPVLAARGPRPSTATIRSVATGLATLGPVVVDLPAGRVPQGWRDLADLVVVLVGLRPRWLRDGERLSATLGEVSQRSVLVTRGPRRAGTVATRAAEHVGLPLLEHLPDDPGVLRDEAHGRAPRPRGPAGVVARAVTGSLADGRSATSLHERVLGLAS